jgi:hypothetical protein
MGRKHADRVQPPQQVRVDPETPPVTTTMPTAPVPPPAVQTVTPASTPKVTKPKHVHTAPIDAGVDTHVDTTPKAVIDEKQPVVPVGPKPVDRNQTINPFAKKHP